jgi:hypothetical protein
MRIAQVCNSHGFPHGWVAAKYHHYVFRKIVSQVEELYDGESIVADGTWINTITTDEQMQQLYPNLRRQDVDHIFYVDLVDPAVDSWSNNLSQVFTQLTTAKESHQIPLKSDFCFWAFVAYHEYSRYFDTSLPWTGDKLFLTYNRKPYRHRVMLVDRLRDLRLMDRGIVTLGNDDPEKALTVDENIVVQNPDVLGEVGIPNDIMSLGDHDIWQQAFVNIVTETITTGTFLSEKIWKPIIGKRPFMLIGPPHTLQRLKNWGFKTFDKYWDESYNELDLRGRDFEYRDLRTINVMSQNLIRLHSMSDRQLRSMYKDMDDILEYNHRHFFGKFADDNEQRMETIVKDEM